MLPMLACTLPRVTMLMLHCLPLPLFLVLVMLLLPQNLLTVECRQHRQPIEAHALQEVLVPLEQFLAGQAQLDPLLRDLLHPVELQDRVEEAPFHRRDLDVLLRQDQPHPVELQDPNQVDLLLLPDGGDLHPIVLVHPQHQEDRLQLDGRNANL